MPTMPHTMPSHELNRYRFPWRNHNRLQLHVDGHAFFPAMFDAIGQARHCIVLEMYLVESGSVLTQFIDRLLEAAERGVQIFLLFDDFGAHGINKGDRQRLIHCAIHLKFYNPLHYGKWRRSLFRDHRKLLLVDKRVAFIGGAGISDHFIGNDEWHDLMVELEGECVHDWLTLFLDSWPGELEQIDCLNEQPHSLPKNEQQQLGRVTISQLSNHQEIQKSLVNRLKNAEHWAWITTAYFVPSWKLRRALKQAARRGADVRLILPGPRTDHPGVRHAGRRFYYSMLRHGVRIFEYQPRFTHTKAYLCDHWCSIGSSNLDRWNTIWNLEGNQEIDDQGFALVLKAQLEHDMGQCDEISLASWQARPWHRRLLEWFWGRIDVWLAQLSARWHR